MTDYLFAVDPGVRHCGVALFKEGELSDIGLVRSKLESDHHRGPELWYLTGEDVALWLFGRADSLREVHLVLEVMQVYGGPQRIDPNDLLELNGIQGAVAGHVLPDRITGYLPRQWKGTVPKNVFTRRILSKLSAKERWKVGITEADTKIGYKHSEIPQSLFHNTVDAIGLGLKALGRLD